MKNAQEIYDIAKEMRAKRDNELREQVRQKVDAFTEKWATKPVLAQEFTWEELVELFGDFRIAGRILKDAGFCVESVPAQETGHLWWKKRTPEKWKIYVPNSKK